MTCAAWCSAPEGAGIVTAADCPADVVGDKLTPGPVLLTPP